MDPKRERRGFTLVELLLAIGLLSILILALLKLVDTSLTIWGRTEENRELLEMGGSVLELFGEDVRALEAGPRGDLLADWVLLDLDGDGIAGAPRPRLRLVRTLSAAELQRLGPPGDRPGETGASAGETFERGLVEVCWALLARGGKEADQRALGVLWRGERVLGERETLSLFDPGFFGPSGKPAPGSLHELTGGVLWFNAWFATQTSIVHDGWELGDGLADCAASWDAWNRGRANAELHLFNLPPAGMPAAKDAPLLPRRVRVELELEREEDLKRRTRLAAELEAETAQFPVQDGRKLPQPPALILVDEEWMRILALDGNRVSVERARRGTRATVHPAGALVHHGWSLVREIPVDVTREDWDL